MTIQKTGMSGNLLIFLLKYEQSAINTRLHFLLTAFSWLRLGGYIYVCLPQILCLKLIIFIPACRFMATLDAR